MPRVAATASSFSLIDGIKKKTFSDSDMERIKKNVTLIKNKVGTTGLLEVLQKAGAQIWKEPAWSKAAHNAALSFENLLLALNENITHDVSWNDVLLRASLYASEMYFEKNSFILNVSELVNDLTDYQSKKWELTMQDKDFANKGSFMHPDLDPEKYVLQVRRLDCFFSLCATNAYPL